MKRADAILAALGLIVLAPTLLATAIAAMLSTKGTPVIRRPMALGRGISAPCYRFRTSADGRLGRFLRQTSLDRLPALVNVIRGEIRLEDLMARSTSRP